METYAVDLSAFLGSGDYIQVGANSIFGGGNAHPTYNYASQVLHAHRPMEHRNNLR